MITRSCPCEFTLVILELTFHWPLIFSITNLIKKFKTLLFKFPTSCTADSEVAFYRNPKNSYFAKPF